MLQRRAPSASPEVQATQIHCVRLKASFPGLRRLLRPLPNGELLSMDVGQEILFRTVDGHESKLSYQELEEITVEKGALLASLKLRITGGQYFHLKHLGPKAVQEFAFYLSRRRMASQVRLRWAHIEGAWRSWLLLGKHEYLRDSQYRRWLEAHQDVDVPAVEELVDTIFTPDELEIIRELHQAFTARGPVDAKNEAFVAEELGTWSTYFDAIENYPLTLQQRLAILHAENNTLIIAGAGTGKTSTIVGKVGYMLSRGIAKADEICLLSFTRKSADEMRARIQKKLSVDLSVRTFHGLGLEILVMVEGKKPSLAKEAEDTRARNVTLGQILEKLVDHDGTLRQAYVAFLTSELVPYRSKSEFKTLGDYAKYFNSSGMRALSGAKVKSYEEAEIANWLFLNGISFVYEAPYRIDTATAAHRQYRPDFHLPDYDIYIEHFGTDKDGRTPPFINQAEYVSGMAWKRNLHQQHGTTLIETFSWMKRDGVLLSTLEVLLRSHDVELRPLPADEVLRHLQAAGYVDPFVNLVGTFLALYKGSGIDEDQLRTRANERGEPKRNETFINVFIPVLKAYENTNRLAGEIDFDDMVRKATGYVRDGPFVSPFRYILVDEFQDISKGRAELLLALRDQIADAQLFCVGDDWQSIYRFTGSDVSLFSGFADVFGFTKATKLDRTFRFNDGIVNFSSRFIMKNPAQVEKVLTPHQTVHEPTVVLVLRGRDADPLPDFLRQIELECPGASVLILERYSFSLPHPEAQATLRRAFKGLKIDFLTAHRSKGLEADFVFVGGLQAGKYGFPSEIADDPVLDLVLARADQYPHGEERRVFYVAVTRAKKKVFIIADSMNPSAFVKEIREDPVYRVEVVEIGEAAQALCPVCKTGELLVRDGVNGLFTGCSSYPVCNHTEECCSRCRRGLMAVHPEDGTKVRCVKCSWWEEICPRCLVGRLRRKNGRHGEFWGCSRFKSESNSCSYTRSIRRR